MAKDNNDKEIQLKKYELALKLAINEGSVLWNYSGSIMIFHSVVMFVILENFNGKITSWVFWVSLMGLLVSFLWLIAYLRRSKYYEFRMAQARELEGKIDDLKLIKGKGEDFAQGDRVKVTGEGKYRLPCIVRCFKARTINILFISLFIIFYFIVSLTTNPWKTIQLKFFPRNTYKQINNHPFHRIPRLNKEP